MRDYFCGWYFKCQSSTQTLAVIPAVHRWRQESSCSIQLITEQGSWNLPFPYDVFQKKKGALSVQVGKNRFGTEGFRLDLHADDISASGDLRFGALSPIRYDIMGPFRYVPFLECRHSIFSMRHKVNGSLCINGTDYVFKDAIGYLEGDRGYSFPKVYAWTQCSFGDGSLMLSVAEIPIGPFRFTGVIGVVLWQGKEYRLATYLGAKVDRLKNGEIIVRQGNLVLSARLVAKNAQPLYAPLGGAMQRTIHESAACRAAYAFTQNGHTLFSFESSKASFEYEYPE